MPNPYKTKHRVELTVEGTDHSGVVDKVVGDAVMIRLDDGRTTKPINHRHVRLSAKPLPQSGANAAWAKWQRVSFEVAGPRGQQPVRVHGTVTGTGKTVKVMADGGESEYSVPPGMLSPSDKVQPPHEPDPIDDWGVASYKESRAQSEETVAFVANVTYRGQAVLRASNAGQGGCNSYMPLPGMPRGIGRDFDAAAKDWFARNGVGDPFEPTDAFVTWHATMRPFAVTGPEFIRRGEERMAEMRAPRP